MYNAAPYMFQAPASTSLFSGATSFLRRINWSSLLSNAQKTLNVVNQAVPLYYQVKPIFKNMKALGRIGKEFTKMSNNKEANTTTSNNVNNSDNNSDNTQSNTQITQSIPTPTFFL